MNIEDSIKTLKEFNKIKINSYAMQFVNISYPDLQEAIETLLTAYEKEKEKNKNIDEFCRKELAFERRLKRENRQPDEFNQGRFYVSENVRKIIEEE